MKTKKTNKKNKTAGRDIIADAMLLGMGLFDIGKEKVQKMADDFRKDKNLSREEARKKAEKFLKNVEKNRKDLEVYVRKQVKLAMEDFDKAAKRGGKRKRK